MRLLITTQVVDSKDSNLGFFVRWIEEFATRVESVEVICLKEGTHTLPSNVHVHSLGKETGASRAKYLLRFYSFVWNLRHRYDAVFVHMNPEYVVLGAPLWRMWGKRVTLWYLHKSVDAKLRLATRLAQMVFTASPESFRLASSKVQIVGHGIDTNFFSPNPSTARTSAVLSVGRLFTSKRHDLVIRSAEHFPNDVRIVGDGPEKHPLENLAKQLSFTSRIHFLGGRVHESLREEYRTAGVFVHTSETGSLDKVVLEALACGLRVVTTNPAMSRLPVTVVPATPEAIAEEVLKAPHTDSEALAGYVQKHHSLERLIPAILRALQTV